VLVPLPSVVTPPGVRVNVHVPLEGNPLSKTLPVAKTHVGWVMVPTMGAFGVTGCALMTTLADGSDVQPSELVTVNVYVPVPRPETVVLVPLPVVFTSPGERVIVHAPDGNPLRTTLPVDTSHVGWVIVPIRGVDGVGGCAGITTFEDVRETHP
jgi:hypothetical protein